jgi:hypothetical protein
MGYGNEGGENVRSKHTKNIFLKALYIYMLV